MATNHRKEAIQIAQNYLAQDPIYIDTETTGFHDDDVIVEIAIVDSQGVSLFNSLVRPNKPIPAGATAVNGLTDASVAGAPKWPQVWPLVQEVIRDQAVGFYNAKFDLRMMRQSCGLNGISWEPGYRGDFCVMELFAQFFGQWDTQKNGYSWQKLEFAGRYFNIPDPNAHRAEADAILTRLVLEAMAASEP
jgi:DNA polymerase-3 subunit epsilon